MGVEVGYVGGEEGGLGWSEKEGYGVGEVGLELEGEGRGVDEGMVMEEGRGVGEEVLGWVGCLVGGERGEWE